MQLLVGVKEQSTPRPFINISGPLSKQAKMKPMVVYKCLVFDHSLNLILTLNFLFQIKVENRYKHNGNDDCMLSMDGTDFLIPENGKRWFSYKFRKSGIRYEVVFLFWGKRCAGSVGLIAQDSTMIFVRKSPIRQYFLF